MPGRAESQSWPGRRVPVVGIADDEESLIGTTRLNVKSEALSLPIRPSSLDPQLTFICTE